MTWYKLVCLAGILLVVSCQYKRLSETEFLLRKAERMMNTRPDSALFLLQQIPQVESLDGELQARYCLLLSQARDKNFLPILSDSLIQIAANYYLQHDDSLRKAQTLYYSGRVYEERTEDDKATRYFLQALHALGNIGDNNLAGVIHAHLGNRYLAAKLYKESIGAHQKACYYAEKDKDTIGLSLSLRDVGFTYMQNKQTDSMFYYYDKALATAQTTRDHEVIVPILSEMGYIYMQQNQHEKAIQLVQKSLELETDTIEKYPSYLMLGYIYSNLNQYERAKYWTIKSVPAARVDIRQEAFKLLYSQEKKLGNYQQALGYLEQYILYRDSIESERWQENILNIQQKYESEQLKNKAQQAENRTLKNQILSLAIITILLVLIGVLWKVYKFTKLKNERELNKIKKLLEKNYRELESYRIELYRSEEKEELLREQLVQNEKEISETQKQNSEKHKRLASFNQKLLTEMELLKQQQKENEQKSLAILRENSHLQSQLKVKEQHPAESLIELIRNLKCTPTLIQSESEWELLREFENSFYNSFVDKLEEYSNLTQREKEVCCLVRLGLNNPDIATVLCIDTLSVTKYKTRAKEKISFQSKSSKTLEQILQSL